METKFEHIWEEQNVEKAFIYDNRPCIVVQNPNIGHYCGYTKTELPSVNHSNISYNGEDNYIKLIEVHGGITYGIDGEGWVGFDCAHADDVCWNNDSIVNGDIAHKHRDGKTKDWRVEDVVEETKYLADQISALEQYLENNFPAFNSFQ